MIPGELKKFSVVLRPHRPIILGSLFLGVGILVSPFIVGQHFALPKWLGAVGLSIGLVVINTSWALILIEQWFSPASTLELKIGSAFPRFYSRAKSIGDWVKSIFLIFWVIATFFALSIILEKFR